MPCTRATENLKEAAAHLRWPGMAMQTGPSFPGPACLLEPTVRTCPCLLGTGNSQLLLLLLLLLLLGKKHFNDITIILLIVIVVFGILVIAIVNTVGFQLYQY